MSEQTALPPPDEPLEPSAVIPPPPPPPPRDRTPWLYGLGFIVLAAAIYYVWQYPNVPPESPVIQATAQRLADVDARLTRMEQRPTPDLGKISAKVDVLEGRVADQTQLASRVDAVSGRIEALSARGQTGIDSLKQQIDAISSRVAAVEANSGSIDASSKRLNRIARLQEASVALSLGRPVGDVPNAPAALNRFSHVAPPSEATLRMGFVQAQQAALASKQPDEVNAPFIDRVWDRAQGLLTIRRGDDVIVGSPTAMTLNHAQSALDAGDLSGAVAAVETLQGPPAQAMAVWLESAKGLLNARSALDQLAGQG